MNKAIALQIIAMSDAYSFVGEPVLRAHLYGYWLTKRHILVEKIAFYIEHFAITLCIRDVYLVTVNIESDVGNSPTIIDNVVGSGYISARINTVPVDLIAHTVESWLHIGRQGECWWVENIAVIARNSLSQRIESLRIVIKIL